MLRMILDNVTHQIMLRKLRRLAGSGQRRAVRIGTNKGLTILLRGIRQQIPPSQKSVRRSLGRKGLKLTKADASGGKVGLGVGKRKLPPTRPPGRPGLGISKRNVHWWALGTGDRYTKSGRYTGRMPAGPPVVKAGSQAAFSDAMREMRTAVFRVIRQEANKP